MTVHLTHLFRSVSPLLAESLLASIWQGLLLTAVAAVGISLVPKISAAARFTLWTLLFVLIAFLPLLPAAYALIPIARALPKVPEASAIHLAVGWAVAIALLWITASLVSLSLVFHDFCALRKLAKSATLVARESLGSEIAALLQNAEIRLSSEIDIPGVVGFVHPVVLFPTWLWAKLGPSELKQVVLHEMAHLRRRDDWTGLGIAVLRSLFPLNPALAWIERKLRFERERASDDAVLGASQRPREYAACLAKLAEVHLARRTAALAPGAWERRSELTRRVQSILEPGRDRSSRARISLVAASLSAAFVGALVLAGAPSVVSFSTISANGTATIAKAAGAGPMPASLSFPAHMVQASFHMPQPKSRSALMKSGHPVVQRRRSLSSRLSSHRAYPYRQAALSTTSVFEEVRIAEDGTSVGRAWIVFTTYHAVPGSSQIHSTSNWIVIGI